MTFYQCERSLYVIFERLLGASTSGKSRDFGSRIPRFESWRPSHLVDQARGLGVRGMIACHGGLRKIIPLAEEARYGREGN